MGGVRKTLLGTNPDGSDHYLYDFEDAHCIMATGPAVGLVQLGDGTLLDVTEAYIDLSDQCQGHDEEGKPVGDCPTAEVSHHISVQHERTGRLDNKLTGEKWLHTDCQFAGCESSVDSKSAKKKGKRHG